MIDSSSAPIPTPPEFESAPLTRSEYIAAVTHFYRAEMDRATVWRIRLDTTTNWSIISVMALISFAMGGSDRSHLGLVVGMVMVLTFLVIEARRFRFYDIWHARVRMLEQNFVGPILKRDQVSPIQDWGHQVADDLLRPRYKLSWLQAFKIRLVRNYLPMFALLLICWVVKIGTVHKPFGQPELSENWWARLVIGGIPAWVSIVLVGLLYGFLIGVIAGVRTELPTESEFINEDYRPIRFFDR